MRPATYQVEVEGVGTFTFRRRTMRDAPRIEQMMLDILGPSFRIASIGDDSAREYVANRAAQLAQLETLMVQSADGWSLDDLDPLDEDDVKVINKVYGRFLEEEERFRKGIAKERQGSGAAT